MKLLYALLALAFLASPCTAELNETEQAYYAGLSDGYQLGYAALAGQSDAGYEVQYNDMIAGLNAWLNASNGTEPRWAPLQKAVAGYTLPPIYSGSKSLQEIMG